MIYDICSQDMQEPITYITILNLGSLQWFDLSICYKKKCHIILGVLLIIVCNLFACSAL